MAAAPSTAPTSRDWATRFGIKAYRYRALIKRRWWILAVAISLALAAEAWILVRQPVEYESGGSLIVGGTVDTGSGPRYTEDQDGFYVTMIKIIQSPELQDRTQRRLALAAPQLNGSIDIIPSIVPRSHILSVVGRGSSPEYTQRFVQGIMEEFINYRSEQKSQAFSQTAGKITDEMTATRAELARQRADLLAFQEKNNMAFWDQEKKASVDMLTGLKKQQAARTTELQQLQNLTSEQLLNRGSLQNTAPKSTGDDIQASGGDGTGAIGSDLGGQYVQITQELVQRRAELEEKSKVWKPKHPGIKKIKDEIDRLQRLIQTIKNQSKESTQGRIESVKAELKSLDASIEVWDKKVMEAARMDAQYQMLQGAVTSTENQLEKLAGNVKEVGSGGSNAADVLSIMGTASPAKQVPAGVVQHLVVGLILGLLVGGLILFLIDRADDRISSSTEMIEYFSEPILGQIPNVDESRVDTGLPLLQHDDERYTFAESLRSLRSSLIFMPNQGELKTLIVTSSIPGEGKSTVSSNLAITMALAGARVLVVDADLRRGDLASLFDVDGRAGLSSVLRGEVEWRDAVQKTKHPTLTLLPRGPVTNQSGELLLVPRFGPLLEDFKNNFDLTIFNTSPILATDDTATIAPNFDGTLMVIRAQFTGAHLAHNSLNALYQRQVNVLGLILNCVDTEMPDYYYYRYPKYYAV